jgi:hypothetical protein
MSIYVYITRRADPADEAGPEITAEEWERCVDAEADFRAPREEELDWLGDHARMWTGYKVPVAFDWGDGYIEVKNPDAEIITRMKSLAGRLRATVFSETGELFDLSGRHAGFLPGFPGS